MEQGMATNLAICRKLYTGKQIVIGSNLVSTPLDSILFNVLAFLIVIGSFI
jgi:hypothetical protein